MTDMPSGFVQGCEGPVNVPAVDAREKAAGEVVLLKGGTKRTQQADIVTAKRYWRLYNA